ncbi:hypothetical protein HK097_010747 [Rhizophlyctis rosea]|uniref:Uncharacterized protein n=1 Tax=Rhizophlyctis rosea TaxID=64517 RepID=A0AAD5X2C1_9FUNG|nr:hypothetical protein HK097_010747 [Rhizophlyctis rosea]
MLRAFSSITSLIANTPIIDVHINPIYNEPELADLVQGQTAYLLEPGAQALNFQVRITNTTINPLACSAVELVLVSGRGVRTAVDGDRSSKEAELHFQPIGRVAVPVWTGGVHLGPKDQLAATVSLPVPENLPNTYDIPQSEQGVLKSTKLLSELITHHLFLVARHVTYHETQSLPYFLSESVIRFLRMQTRTPRHQVGEVRTFQKWGEDVEEISLTGRNDPDKDLFSVTVRALNSIFLPEQNKIHGTLLFTRLQEVPMRIPRIMVELMEKSNTSSFPERILSKAYGYSLENLAVSKDSPITIPFRLDLNYIHPDIDALTAASTNSPIISHVLRVTIRVVTPKNESTGLWKMTDLTREERFEIPISVKCTTLAKRESLGMQWKTEVPAEDTVREALTTPVEANGGEEFVKRAEIEGQVEREVEGARKDSEDEVLQVVAENLKGRQALASGFIVSAEVPSSQSPRTHPAYTPAPSATTPQPSDSVDEPKSVSAETPFQSAEQPERETKPQTVDEKRATTWTLSTDEQAEQSPVVTAQPVAPSPKRRNTFSLRAPPPDVDVIAAAVPTAESTQPSAVTVKSETQPAPTNVPTTSDAAPSPRRRGTFSLRLPPPDVDVIKAIAPVGQLVQEPTSSVDLDAFPTAPTLSNSNPGSPKRRSRTFSFTSPVADVETISSTVPAEPVHPPIPTTTPQPIPTPTPAPTSPPPPRPTTSESQIAPLSAPIPTTPPASYTIDTDPLEDSFTPKSPFSTPKSRLSLFNSPRRTSTPQPEEMSFNTITTTTTAAKVPVKSEVLDETELAFTSPEEPERKESKRKFRPESFIRHIQLPRYPSGESVTDLEVVVCTPPIRDE